MSATRKCFPESLNGQHENCEHGRKDFHCWHFTTKHPGTRRRYLGGRTRNFPWNHCLGASPWHEILHGWNHKVQVLSDYAGLKPWSVTCVEAVWKFASYVATLPSERWTRRILHWNIRGRRTRGRPAYTWETALERYCIWKGFDNWIVEAFEYGHWMRFKEDFVFFTLYTS